MSDLTRGIGVSFVCCLVLIIIITHKEKKKQKLLGTERLMDPLNFMITYCRN